MAQSSQTNFPGIEQLNSSPSGDEKTDPESVVWTDCVTFVDIDSFNQDTSETQKNEWSYANCIYYHSTDANILSFEFLSVNGKHNAFEGTWEEGINYMKQVVEIEENKHVLFVTAKAIPNGIGLDNFGSVNCADIVLNDFKFGKFRDCLLDVFDGITIKSSRPNYLAFHRWVDLYGYDYQCIEFSYIPKRQTHTKKVYSL